MSIRACLGLWGHPSSIDHLKIDRWTMVSLLAFNGVLERYSLRRYRCIGVLSLCSFFISGTSKTSREPCPDRILDDLGGAFGMGAKLLKCF
ncbi:hypothetical protein ACOSQ3_004474 [Xanthoceras sorbifolium]